MLRILTPVKIRRLRPGLNPRTWVKKPVKETCTPSPGCLLFFNSHSRIRLLDNLKGMEWLFALIFNLMTDVVEEVVLAVVVKKKETKIMVFILVVLMITTTTTTKTATTR